jgi:hypothetical protein
MELSAGMNEVLFFHIVFAYGCMRMQKPERDNQL